jgi:hypothetical protein
MGGDDRHVIERMVWLFNHMLEPDDTPYRPELERVWADEPEIVPMRAALEGNAYRGPTALDDFRAESIEAWSELEIELGEITGSGPRYLCTGTLRGRGRESGAEIVTQMWAVIDMEDGRATRLAAHLDRNGALAEFE